MITASRTRVTILPNVVEFPSMSMDRFSVGFSDAIRQVKPPAWDFDFARCSGAEPWMQILPKKVEVRLSSLWGRWIKYPKVIRNLQSDVFHILDHSHAILVDYLDAERTVVNCFDVIPLLSNLNLIDVPYKPWVLASFHKRIECMRRAARVVCVSDSTRNDLIKYANFNPARVSVVPIGLEPDFSPHPPLGDSLDDERLQFAKQYGLSPYTSTILQVGTRNRYKNTPTALHVLREISQNKRDVCLLRVGAPFFEDELLLIEKLGIADRIFHIGRLSESDLRRAYRFASLLLFPSLYEGFGWPVLEAMASGCPVVVSNKGSLPEVVRDQTLCFDPHDINGMSDKICTILEDESVRAKCVVAGLGTASTYSWEATARETLTLYDQVMAGVTP